MAWVLTVPTGADARIDAAVKAQITRVGFMTSPSAVKPLRDFIWVSGKDGVQLQRGAWLVRYAARSANLVLVVAKAA
jgi:hypothetical protein